MKQKTSEQQEDVWVENDHRGQTLSHTFFDQKGYFHLDVGNYENGYVALIFNPDLQSLQERDDSLSLVLPGTNFAFAKKTVDDVIKKYDQKVDQKQRFTEWDIMEDFSRRFKERQQEFVTPSQSIDRQLETAKKAAYRLRPGRLRVRGRHQRWLCLRRKAVVRNERNQRHGEKIRKPRNLQSPRTGHFCAPA